MPSISACQLVDSVYTWIFSIHVDKNFTEWIGIPAEEKPVCPVLEIGKNAEWILIQKALSPNDDFLPPAIVKQN